jgi:hypothetical protein
MVVRSSLGRCLVLRLGFYRATLSINFKDQRAFIQMPFFFSFEKCATLPRAEDVQATPGLESRFIFVV